MTMTPDSDSSSATLAPEENGARGDDRLELLAQVEALPESAARALLRYTLHNDQPPASRRIFVNRSLRLESIRYVGFDLDWTLAPYYRLPLEELIFRLSLDYLVEHGYPPSIRRCEFRPHFPHRGLIVDRETGVVFKMSRHRYVGQAFLGRHRLTRQERFALYRQDPIDLAGDRFYRVDTLFELPEVNLFSELVELGRKGWEFDAPEFPTLFAQVRAAVDTVHANDSLKSRVVADLPRYLPRTEELGLALERLRLGGRKLLLITNSGWSYTEALCRYLFDGVVPGLDSWRDLFHLVIVNARKPLFFRRRLPFELLGPDGSPQESVEVPDWGHCYSGGNLEGLMKRLDVHGEEVLYVGDHIYGDILTTKMSSTWRTALVVRELEDELNQAESLGPDLRRLSALKQDLQQLGLSLDDLRDDLTLARTLELEELTGRTRDRLETTREDHRLLRKRVRELDRKVALRFNPTWGSVFKMGSSMSLFGAQVQDFACLYTSRVSNFAYYGTNHYFRVLEDPMPHDD